jgi:hypothetical protein
MIIVDPKERLKEEKDGIVLSPFRRDDDVRFILNQHT